MFHKYQIFVYLFWIYPKKDITFCWFFVYDIPRIYRRQLYPKKIYLLPKKMYIKINISRILIYPEKNIYINGYIQYKIYAKKNISQKDYIRKKIYLHTYWLWYFNPEIRRYDESLIIMMWPVTCYDLDIFKILNIHWVHTIHGYIHEGYIQLKLYIFEI